MTNETSNAPAVAKEKTSAVETLIAIFLEPSKAFAAISREAHLWLPLLLVLLSPILLNVYYYQIVDLSWLIDKLTEAAHDPKASEQMAKFFTRSTAIYSTVFGIGVVVPLFFAINAGYLLLVSKIKNLNISFLKWFEFTAWTAAPSVLVAVLGLIQVILASNGQILPSQLNPVSINSLFLHLNPGEKFASLADSISLITFWSLFLSIVGFQQWSKLSRAASIFWVSLPSVIFYGAWFLISFLSK